MSVGKADPQKVGEWLKRRQVRVPGELLSVAANSIPWDDTMLKAEADETSGVRAARAYYEELEQRAVKGDRFAIAILNGSYAGEPEA